MHASRALGRLRIDVGFEILGIIGHEEMPTVP